MQQVWTSCVLFTLGIAPQHKDHSGCSTSLAHLSGEAGWMPLTEGREGRDAMLPGSRWIPEQGRAQQQAQRECQHQHFHNRAHPGQTAWWPAAVLPHCLQAVLHTPHEVSTAVAAHACYR